MSRPAADVVVPFNGQLSGLEAMRRRLAELRLSAGDTVVVVHDTPGYEGRHPAEGAHPRVHYAPQITTPGYARNRGAALGSAEWLVFIDGDTDPAPDLLDQYFAMLPDPETVLLAGGIVDEPVPPDAPAAARYAYLRRTMSQDRTMGLGEWGFATGANMAVRRRAFEAVGGFRENIVGAEDADLTYRLKAAGGKVERRESAAVVHLSRRDLRSMVRQAARHGGSAAWLNRQYPGAFPGRRRPGLTWWGARTVAKGCLRALGNRDRDQLIRAMLDPLWELSFEFGRSFSIEASPNPPYDDRDLAAFPQAASAHLPESARVPAARLGGGTEP